MPSRGRSSISETSPPALVRMVASSSNIASTITSGQRFSFVPEFFDALCADLPTYPVSRAVTASSAVPGVFTPITLENFSATCDVAEPAWIARALSVEPGTITGETEWARNYIGMKDAATNLRMLLLLIGMLSFFAFIFAHVDQQKELDFDF